MKYIITYNQEYQKLFASEINSQKDITIEAWLDDGICLANYNGTIGLNQLVYKTPLIFTRHIFRVDQIANLNNNFSGQIFELAKQKLNKALPFSIQLRKHPKSNVSNQEILDISKKLEEYGYILNVKDCLQTISVYVHTDYIYFGISEINENLSKYKGGMPHYKTDENTISRAEFKLLESLETFNITFNTENRKAHAIDLGSAPGGWSNLLAKNGLVVFSVDPAKLDERVKKNPLVNHYQITSQEFVHRNFKIKFDILVNDMKMDMFETVKITSSLKKYMHDGAYVLVTLKLPHDISLPKIKKCIENLSKTYKIITARQLFHNRSEITVLAQNNN